MQGSELLAPRPRGLSATMRIRLRLFRPGCVHRQRERRRSIPLPDEAVDAEEVKKVVADAAAIAEASLQCNCMKCNCIPRFPVDMAGAKPRVLIIDHDESIAKTVHETLGDRCEIFGLPMRSTRWKNWLNRTCRLSYQTSCWGQQCRLHTQDHQQLNPQTQCIVVTSFNDTSRLIELINQAADHRFLPSPSARASGA